MEMHAVRRGQPECDVTRTRRWHAEPAPESPENTSADDHPRQQPPRRRPHRAKIRQAARSSMTRRRNAAGCRSTGVPAREVEFRCVTAAAISRRHRCCPRRRRRRAAPVVGPGRSVGRSHPPSMVGDRAQAHDFSCCARAPRRRAPPTSTSARSARLMPKLVSASSTCAAVSKRTRSVPPAVDRQVAASQIEAGLVGDQGCGQPGSRISRRDALTHTNFRLRGRCGVADGAESVQRQPLVANLSLQHQPGCDRGAGTARAASPSAQGRPQPDRRRQRLPTETDVHQIPPVDAGIVTPSQCCASAPATGHWPCIHTTRPANRST